MKNNVSWYIRDTWIQPGRYELSPSDSRKSFYGKAFVLVNTDGAAMLFSYDTAILECGADGKYTRIWNGWSATTGRHIAAFSGLNKKAYFDLPERSAK